MKIDPTTLRTIGIPREKAHLEALSKPAGLALVKSMMNKGPTREPVYGCPPKGVAILVAAVPQLLVQCPLDFHQVFSTRQADRWLASHWSDRPPSHGYGRRSECPDRSVASQLKDETM